MILIVNPGNQPETQQLFLQMSKHNQNVKYVTSLLFGTDNSYIKGRIVKLLPEKYHKLMRRRLLDVPDSSVIRYLPFIALIITLLPSRLRKIIIPFLNFTITNLAVFSVLIYKPKIVFFQNFVPGTLRFLNSRTKIILILSNVCPTHQLKLMQEEELANPLNFRFFGIRYPSKLKINSFQKSSQTADAIHVPSFFVKDGISRDYPDIVHKIEVLRLGCNLNLLGFDSTEDLQFQRISGLDKKNFTVLFVGQICQRKGLSYLIQAFMEANLPPESKLVIIGQEVNGYSSYLKRHYPKIEMIPFLSREELGTYYLKSSVFVLPSIYEGFSLAAIEAMATGLPCILTRRTLDSLGFDTGAAIEVESGNFWQIKESLEMLANDQNLQKKMINECLHLGQEFTWEIYYKNTLMSLEKRFIITQ